MKLRLRCSSGLPYNFFFPRSLFFSYILVVVLALLPGAEVTADLKSDQDALVDFAAAVPHTRRLNWRNTSSVCSSWHGVTCSSTTSGSGSTHTSTRVIALRLPGFGILGPIPQNTLGRLDALLILSLHSNRLNGTLPSDVLSLPSLRYLYLQHNHFSGNIPSFSSSSPSGINVIDLSFNSFTGSIPLNIQNLPFLTTLYLQNNSLSGSIPNLDLPKLKQINLSNNHLSGSIPTHLQRYPTSSFNGNTMLCGRPLDSCPSPSPSVSLSPSPSPSPSPPQASFPPSESPAYSSGQNLVPFSTITPQTNKSDDDNNNNNNNNTLSSSTGTIIAIILGVGGASVLLFLVACCVMLRRRRKRRELEGKDKMPKEEIQSSGAQAEATGPAASKLMFFQGSSQHNDDCFNLKDLLRASAKVLEKGSYGTTYVATLEGGTAVVVKRLREVIARRQEFELQMKAIRRVSKNHPNIVPLRAYYHSEEEKLLIYDHVPGGRSLSTHLHGNRDQSGTSCLLDWKSRVKLSLGVAKGVAHIHSMGVLMTHGNIKSSNVVVTQEGSMFKGQITDFGLIPITGMRIPASGRAGYLAPEAIETRKSTQKSDVYSFGVLLLELLTGKAPISVHQDEAAWDLPRWVQSVVASEKKQWATAEVLDAHLVPQHQSHIEEEMAYMLQIAKACVDWAPEIRPQWRMLSG